MCLTARGRAVVMLASVAFLLLVIVLSGRFTADAGTQAPSGPATTVVVVQPGESLWQIAERTAPGVDPRELVTAIRAINDLGESTVVAGQSILVPAFAQD
jgi:hypothetical protein